MGGEASIVGVENSGLSLLDITKHALKTIITSLNDTDRLSLVSYSNAAKIVCGLTFMTATGKARALSQVDTLRAGKPITDTLLGVTLTHLLLCHQEARLTSGTVSRKAWTPLKRHRAVIVAMQQCFCLQVS